jgi:Domain of unknown function (DUF4386)
MSSLSGTANIPATTTYRDARIAGALYVIVIAGGLFAGIVQDSLTVPGNAAATAAAIAADESLWRWGIAVHLFYLAIPTTVMNVLLYRIFKPAAPILALLALVSGIVSAAIEGAVLLPLYLPLVMTGSRTALAAIAEGERQTLAYIALRLSESGFGVALFFFSGFCFAIGVAIVRSTLVPRVIGALMIAAGACYFVSSLCNVVAPALAHFLSPWIIIPCFIGEASLAIWLLVKAVRST